MESGPAMEPAAMGRRSGSGLTIEMHAGLPSLEDEWRAFQARAAGEPHQTFEWTSIWLSAHPERHSVEPAIAVCRDGAGQCVAILPFGIRQNFGCTVLEWLGADQGNYSSGLFDPAYWSRGGAPGAEALLRRVLAAVPGIDAVHLAGQPSGLGRIPNPLAALPGVPAPSDGYAFRIGPEWRTESHARFSSRYRKNLKRNTRRLEEHGPLRLVRREAAADRLRTLETIFGQKTDWFAAHGLPDIFANEAIRGFYRALVTAPRSPDEFSVRVYELRAGDEVAAACVDLLHGKRYYGLVASTASGELSRYGPGNIMFHRLVDELAQEGVESFDCGAGENEQKLRWCTERRERRHALVPVTEKGRLYTAALAAKLAAKTQVKQSAWLRRLANLLRRHTPRLFSSLPLLAAGGSAAALLEA